MTKFEKFFIIFIAILFLSFSYAVIKTAMSIQEIIEQEMIEREEEMLNKNIQLTHINEENKSYANC